MPASTPEPPRTLAEQLRGWSDDQVAELLLARPDLASPTPQDTSQLASRVGTRASVVRAVDQLSHLELAVLDTTLALGGTASAQLLRERVHADPDRVDEALDRIRCMCLLWGDDGSLRALSSLTDVVGLRISRIGPAAAALLTTYGPARVSTLVATLGLTPSGDRQEDVAAVAAVLGDPARVTELLDGIDPPARAILDHLEREGRDGSVESTGRSTSRGPGSSPVEQLLDRGLLVARDERHVAVPREVAICLRGGHTTREPVDEVPGLATAARDEMLVDRTAAGAAFELVRHLELLLEHWGTSPPPALRTGGLGVRDLKATGELLLADERTAALHVELAMAAGLLAVGTASDGGPVWLPTDAFDAWTTLPPAQRWARVAVAWVDNLRLTGLVGSRDGSGGPGQRGKPVNALVPDLERMWLPETRRAALQEVADLEPGTVLAAGTGVPSLVERMAWQRPRRPPARAQAVAWALEESAVLGLTALSGMAAHGRALLTSGDQAGQVAAASVLAPLLPEPVDHVLLQADLTAVAPGPLEPELARNLSLVADIESRGGATVYRLTESSVRRSFDSGWSAAEVHAFIASASRTPVPQALTYLVDDVSRRFGTVRVGAAESFLRSDDEAALAELVHHPRSAALRLRRIAPTVVVSDVPVDVLLPRLRELGAAPVVEASDGTVRVARRESMRARTPRPRPVAPDAAFTPRDAQATARLAARVSSTVTAIRAGDRAAATRPAPALRAGEATTPASTLAVLREAVEAGQSVWIGYVDSSGSTVERVVDPVKVDAGWLSAYDHRTEDVRSFAVHRVTGVHRVEEQ